MRLPLIGLLLVLIVLQAVVALVMLGGSPARWTPPAAEPPTASAATPLSLSFPTLDAGGYFAQVERPLFVPGRRPISPDGQAMDADEGLPADMRLIGIFGTDGDGGVIVTVEGGLRRIPVGGRIGSAVLLRLEGRDAVFSVRGVERRVAIRPVAREATEAVDAAPEGGEQSAAPTVGEDTPQQTEQ